MAVPTSHLMALHPAGAKLQRTGDYRIEARQYMGHTLQHLVVVAPSRELLVVPLSLTPTGGISPWYWDGSTDAPTIAQPVPCTDDGGRRTIAFINYGVLYVGGVPA